MSTTINADYWAMMGRTMQERLNSQSEFYVDPSAVDRHLAGVSKNIKDWAGRQVAGFTEISAQKKLTAEQVLTKAMSALTEADRYQFLLLNLVEGLKRGETPAAMIRRYNEIGLTEIEIEPTPPPPVGVMANPEVAFAEQAPVKPVRFIRTMLNGLASMCGWLIKIAIIAAKIISQHIKIKFKPVAGTSAFLPSLSFLLETEFEGEVKISECFEGLEAILNRFAHSAF